MARPRKPLLSTGAEIDQAVLHCIERRIKWLQGHRKFLKELIRKKSHLSLMAGGGLWSAEDELTNLQAVKKLLKKKQVAFAEIDRGAWEWNQADFEWREDNFENLYVRSSVIRLLADLAVPEES